MKSFIKTAAMAVAGLVLVGIAIDPASAQGETIAPGMEENTDRPGADYSSFTITSRDPGACKSACLDDNRCSAWTYVRPGVQGETARCYLKNQIPAAVASNCCISGARATDQAAAPYDRSVADAVRQPSAVEALDEVGRLKAEVKKLKEDIVRLSSAVQALESHTHQYSTVSFGHFAIPCSRLQAGATGSCYVMLNPKTAQPQTQPPTK